MSTLIINNPLLQTLAITLLHFLWQGLLVACVLKVMLSIISTTRSIIRYGITCVAMVANLFLPLATFYYFYQPISSNALTPNHIIPLESFQQVLQQNASVLNYQQATEYLPYLSVAWIVWVLFLTTKLLFEVALVNRLPYQDAIEADRHLLDRFSELANKVGLMKTPQLVISLKAQVPMAIGWLKPVVLMPAKMVMGLTQEQLEMLLLHELAHIRRYDYLVNFFQTLIEILLFFHPAVSWVSKQMRQEREYCSDDIAVSHCGHKKVAYAHTLADTAALCRSHRHSTIPAMAMAASGGDLKARVVRLVDHSCTSQQESGKWLAAVTIVITTLCIATKQFVSMPLSEFHLANTTLFKPSLDNEVSYSAQIAENSIAQQLLAPEIKVSRVKPVNNDSFVEQGGAASTNNQANAFPSKPISTSTLATAATEKQIVPTITLLDTPETQALPTTKERTANQPVTKLSSANESTVEANIETVITEDAIAPLQQSFKDENPYAQQVASLNEEIAAKPSTVEQVLATEPEVQEKSKPMIEEPNALFGENNAELSLFEQRYQSAQRRQLEAKPIKEDAILVNAIDPKYPSVAKRKGIELEVFVNFTIDKNGKVKDIQFEQQSRLSYFRKSITSAMEQWQFEPARVDGKPVKSTMSKIFSFNMS